MSVNVPPGIVRGRVRVRVRARACSLNAPPCVEARRRGVTTACTSERCSLKRARRRGSADARGW
eukprot:1257454-Prymnesium_polylepis.1